MGIIYKNGTYYGGGSGGGGATYTAGDGINIDENNEISTNNMSAEDMEEVVSPMPSVMSRRMKYSTDEQIVGTWIDGKPLYQKTVSTVSQDSVWVEVAHNISNIKQVCFINGVVGDTTGLFATGGCVGTSFERVFFQANTLSVKCYVAGNSGLINKPVYITLQYTKTTD